MRGKFGPAYCGVTYRRRMELSETTRLVVILFLAAGATMTARGVQAVTARGEVRADAPRGGAFDGSRGAPPTWSVGHESPCISMEELASLQTTLQDQERELALLEATWDHLNGTQREDVRGQDPDLVGAMVASAITESGVDLQTDLVDCTREPCVVVGIAEQWSIEDAEVLMGALEAAAGWGERSATLIAHSSMDRVLVGVMVWETEGEGADAAQAKARTSRLLRGHAQDLAEGR